MYLHVFWRQPPGTETDIGRFPNRTAPAAAAQPVRDRRRAAAFRTGSQGPDIDLAIRLKGAFVAILEREPRLPRLMAGPPFDHVPPHKAIDGSAASSTVERFRKSVQAIAGCID